MKNRPSYKPINKIMLYKVQLDDRIGSQRRLYFAFELLNFEQEKLNQAINLAVYGVPTIVHLLQTDGLVSQQGILAFDQCCSSVLQLLTENRQQLFNLLDVTHISQDLIHLPSGLIDRVKDHHFISLHYQGRMLYLEFQSQDVRNLMQQALQHFLISLTYKVQFINHVKFTKTQLAVWSQSELTVLNISKFLQAVKINLLTSSIQTLFGTKTNLDQLWSQIQSLLVKQEVRQIFTKYCPLSVTDDFKGSMEIQMFQEFLEQEQNEVQEEDEIKTLFALIRQGDQTLEYQSGKMSFINFSEYLFSTINEIADVPKEASKSLYLHEYFVFTSYEALLSSFDPHRFKFLSQYTHFHEGVLTIIYPLLRGVKYLQIDVWDGQQGEPCCIYGMMQIHRIPFRSVLETIKTFAFKITKDPLFLSIIDHCETDQANDVTVILLDEIGHLIELPPGDNPTLRDLQGKIILTGPVNTVEHRAIKIMSNLRIMSTQNSEKFQTIHPVRDKVTLTGVQHEYRLFEIPLDFQLEQQTIVEINEKQLESSKEEIARLKQLVKLLPRNAYYNLDPGRAFNYGVNIPLFRQHVIDYNYMFYYALMNGHDGIAQGYVQRIVFKLRYEGLVIKLISGRFLANNIKSKIRIQIEILVKDSVSQLVQQGTVEEFNNPLNPQFYEEFTFQIRSHYAALMAIVYVDDTLTLWNAIRVDRLKPGYRFLPLLDQYLNRRQYSGLFVHLQHL